MTTAPNPVSSEAARSARQMRSLGVSWSEICRRLGVSMDKIRRAAEDGYTESRRQAARDSRRNMPAGPDRLDPRPSEHDVLARRAEIPDDTRTLTGRIFGDPLPGRSARDRVHHGEPR